MNPEERLSDALHAVVGNARPSPDLADRIVERVSSGGRPVTRFNAPLGLAAAAVLLLLAVALVPLTAGIRSNGALGRGGTSASPTPTVAPTGLAHFSRHGLTFDYPAAWESQDLSTDQALLNEAFHYFLGTGSATTWCPTPSPAATDETSCGYSVSLAPHTVAVVVSQPASPVYQGRIDPTDPTALSPGQKYATVGGLPAIFQESGGGPDTTLALEWTLSVPGGLNDRYLIHVEMFGPDTDSMRAQVEAMVASLKYDPSVPVLNPSDGPTIASIALAQAAADDPSLRCFQAPGAAGPVTATVTKLPGYAQLRKPLPVTCATTIEPNAIGLWKMTLTESWTAAADRSAGSVTTILWLTVNGYPSSVEYSSVRSGIPYWP